MKIWADIPVSELSSGQLLDEHRTVHAYFAMLGGPRWKNHPLMRYSEEFMRDRHEQQVQEMLRRGHNHNTPIRR